MIINNILELANDRDEIWEWIEDNIEYDDVITLIERSQEAGFEFPERILSLMK